MKHKSGFQTSTYFCIFGELMEVAHQPVAPFTNMN